MQLNQGKKYDSKSKLSRFIIISSFYGIKKSCILYKWVCGKCYHSFANLTLKEAFEPAVQLNKQLKREEFDCSWGKKFKFLIHRFLFMFSQNVEKW